ncbi:MAG: hypothetical protein BRC26_02450, partial [Nanohaloarchaea archaeon QH_8_44_6]
MADTSDSFKKWFDESFSYWFLEPPNPRSDPEDNIWHEFDLFKNEWVNIQNRLEWYESPNVPNIYKNHVYLFKNNMEFPRPEETYYKENVESHEFDAEIDCTTELPSGKGDLRINVNILTKTPPSGENNFAMVQYLVDTEMKYDMPRGIGFLPRFLARPLNRTFKFLFMLYIGEEMIEYDGEWAIEKTREYFQYIRKYHGEEPIQTKSRQAEFKP